MRVQQELAAGDTVDDDAEVPESHWLTDFVGSWLDLGKEHPEAADVAAGLAAQLGVLDDEQLEALTESIESTAEELRARDEAEAGEPPEAPESAEREFVRTMGAEVARRTGATGSLSQLGVPGVDLGVTQQARSIAGSLVPDGLSQMLPEAAVVSLAASAGMRIRNGEPVTEVKKWLVGELSTIGVANAASVAVQLLSGLVVLRPPRRPRREVGPRPG